MQGWHEQRRKAGIYMIVEVNLVGGGVGHIVMVEKFGEVQPAGQLLQHFPEPVQQLLEVCVREALQDQRRPGVLTDVVEAFLGAEGHSSEDRELVKALEAELDRRSAQRGKGPLPTAPECLVRWAVKDAIRQYERVVRAALSRAMCATATATLFGLGAELVLRYQLVLSVRKQLPI
jgi:hypothetical protein